jgi:hypothetical protein
LAILTDADLLRMYTEVMQEIKRRGITQKREKLTLPRLILI